MRWRESLCEKERIGQTVGSFTDRKRERERLLRAAIFKLGGSADGREGLSLIALMSPEDMTGFLTYSLPTAGNLNMVAQNLLSESLYPLVASA